MEPGYYNFLLQDGDEGTGSFQVFHTDQEVMPQDGEWPDGWYWAPGFPGCLWDADPTGPFDTIEEAFKDANCR